MQSQIEGQMLGKYQILNPLGRGGMARVYRAYHAQLDRYVAVKILRSDLVDAGDFLARFQREARAVASLRHPNIVQVYDFDVETTGAGPIYYMVMELLEGDTLKSRLQAYHTRNDHMPLGESLRVLLDVLNGLGYAHTEGVIHRDIKPANILLSRQGQAVLGDFGIAQIVGGARHTAVDALLGTVAYVAPEQGLEGHSDPRSDLYSIGVVLYEMLTQRPPFDADTPLAVLLRHVNDPLPLPGDVVIPQPLERVLLKALAKQPEARYQSAAEMAEALRRAAQELELPLPEQLPPPLTFTTVEAPTEDVAIYSGAARAQVTDTGFADDDTNVTAVPSKALELVRPAATTPRETFALRLRGNTYRLPVKGETGTIIAASTFAPAWNLLGIMAAGITTRPLFTYGWPAELFLVSLILSAVMWTAQSIWLLIPTLLVLGNGMLFSYYTLTGNWEQWAFLWPLELFIAGGAICAPFILARLRGVNRENTGLLGFNLGVLSLAAVLFISVAALVKW
ncbi:MAG: Serine/threonine-protein kinase PrkC [Chloroflexi bacterium ADurb.Bin360]|nr:MAG: Serine/threonine-protein kinase PrkC [Chloroflexi bacterium ADurb.Bin360]